MIRPEPTSTRRPPELEPETVIHLTPWDLQMVTVEHIQKGILLPKHPQGHSHAVERLASSFALALGRFYPFAGRLTVEELQQDGGIAMSLRCSGEGAEFVHAVAPGVTVADITSPVYVPPVVWSFFPLDGVLGLDAAVASLPVLAVQATELDDGVFLAMSLNHGVADGTTFWHFFNTWSEISRRSGNHDAAAIGCEIASPLPLLQRWFPEGCPIPIPLPFDKPEDIVGDQRAKYPSVQECFFRFSAESVKELKAKANAEMAGAPATISSLQALFAHMWRAVCRARRLARDQDVTYIILVGCRGRLESMPSAYMGNAVSLIMARSTAGEILDKGLGWAGWLLNRAVASFNMASATAETASWPRNPGFVRPLASVLDGQPKLSTGSSPRFDIYGNDFGWGSPVTVRSGSANKVDGKMTVYEGGEGAGSMALEVCLAPEALARLVADQEFMDVVSSTKE